VSQENVEIVRRAYNGWAHGDFSEGEVFHPEVEFDMVDWPEQSTSRGLDAMRRTWQASLASWDDFRAEAADFIDVDECVVVLTRVRARGKGSGAEVSANTATVWTFEDGKVVRLALYWDSAKALEAVGLQP
jgi:ketosteroid isomerase-like protein